MDIVATQAKKRAGERLGTRSLPHRRTQGFRGDILGAPGWRGRAEKRGWGGWAGQMGGWVGGSGGARCAILDGSLVVSYARHLLCILLRFASESRPPSPAIECVAKDRAAYPTRPITQQRGRAQRSVISTVNWRSHATGGSEPGVGLVCFI